MGTHLQLTERGQKVKDRLERICLDLGSARQIGDDDFVLLEIGREQPIGMDRFLSHMEELGFDDRTYVQDVVADWHFSGYVE